MPLPLIPQSGGSAPTTWASAMWLERAGYAALTLTPVDELVAFAPLTAAIVTSAGTGAVAPALVRETLGGAGEMSLTVYLTGSSPADLRTQLDALDAYLRAPCRLYVRTTDSAVSWVDVLHAQPVRPELSGSADLSHWLTAKLTLTCTPWFESDRTALLSAAALTVPGSVAITSPSTYPAPLELRLRSLAYSMRGLYAALGKTGQALLKSAASITFGASSASSDAAQYCDTVAVYSTTAAVSVVGLEAGPYLVLVRAKAGVYGTVTVFDTAYGSVPVYASDANWALVPVALFTASERTKTFEFTTQLDAGSGPLLVDYVYFLPLQYGALWFNAADPVTDWCSDLYRVGDATWVDSEPDRGLVTGATPRLAGSGMSLYVVGTDLAGAAGSYSFEATALQTPRFAWLR